MDENQYRLAAFLDMPLAQLDMRLPGLRWVNLGHTYAVLDETGARVPLMINGTKVTEIAATLIDYQEASEEELPEAVAARELRRLMTEYAHARAATVLIAEGRRFR